MTSGALAGVTVVDLTSYIAGSYAAMMLADLGADVIKVEALEGDSFRELPGFYGWNRGKRSIAVNLKAPDGRAIVHRLAEHADVVMENMRPGVVERLGVDYETLRAINPRLIYSTVTAFGSDGPYKDRPGFDPLLQAMGGLMTLQGFGGRPSTCASPRPTTTARRWPARRSWPRSSCASAPGEVSACRPRCSRRCSRCSRASSSTTRARKSSTAIPPPTGSTWPVTANRSSSRSATSRSG